MIGVLGGTFNPIHFGHIHLAISLKEACSLKEIWFIPANISPLRVKEESVSPEKRYKMVELAVEDIPDFHVLDIEINRPGPSFTIETIEELLIKEHNLAWLMGSDALKQFAQWREYERIAKLVPLLIGSRLPSQSSSLLLFPEDVKKTIQQGLVEIPQMEISATTIRERLKKGLYCGHLVPGKVLDYIYENQLY